MSPDLSHVRGPSAPPLSEATIGEALDAAAALWSDREALVCPHEGVRWTYAELASRSDRIARALLGLGLAPGDRIGIWAPNGPQWALTQFAAAKAGLILVTINPAYRAEELGAALVKVGAKALVTAARFKSSDYLAMLRSLAPEIAFSRPGALEAAALPALRLLIQIDDEAQPGFLGFDELYDRTGPELPRTLSNRDPINIQFTSGTTGLPKGAVLSHRSILNNGRFVGLSMGLGEGDRLCIPVPLYHCFGMVMGNLACVSRGATMVYPGPGFDAAATLAIVQAERCTHLHGVPTMFIAELEHPDFASFDLSSLRGGVMAGASCPIEVMRRVTERMNMSQVTIAYGMTETSPVSFQSHVDDPLERRVETVGRVQPHLEVKLVDDQGAIVPRGVPGEICTRGYSVMLGYWDEPQKTAEVLDSEGFMHTGDLGVIDAEGYCRVVGRLKDIIIRGGENIAPREIEDFLFSHPMVEEVHVIGVPDPKYGEEICACIRVRPGADCSADEIIAYCRGRIAHFKTPRHVVFVDAFPLTATGKVRKLELRDDIIRRMELAGCATRGDE